MKNISLKTIEALLIDMNYEKQLFLVGPCTYAKGFIKEYSNNNDFFNTIIFGNDNGTEIIVRKYKFSKEEIGQEIDPYFNESFKLPLNKAFILAL